VIIMCYQATMELLFVSTAWSLSVSYHNTNNTRKTKINKKFLKKYFKKLLREIQQDVKIKT